MARLGFSFDPNSVEPRQDMSPLPDGNYVAMVAESKITKDSNQTDMLAMALQIIEGPYKGRYVWLNLNLWNRNQTAATIAAQQLAELCFACGFNTPVDDSELLHNKPIGIKVKYIPAGPDKKGIHRDERNEIKGFKALDNAQGYQVPARGATPPAHTSAPAQVSAAAAPAGAGAPVWARK